MLPLPLQLQLQYSQVKLGGVGGVSFCVCLKAPQALKYVCVVFVFGSGSLVKSALAMRPLLHCGKTNVLQEKEMERASVQGDSLQLCAAHKKVPDIFLCLCVFF